MAKNASIFTRIDPTIKEQAETVLNQLGISMATAMEIYLRQIAMQHKIPFEIALPTTEPIVLSSLSKEKFDELMEQAMKSYNAGECTPIEDFEKEFRKELGI